VDDAARTPEGRPSRRTLIGAAAWSVPVIAVATATPAFAASAPIATLSFTSFSASQKKQKVTVSYEVLVSGATTVTGSLLVQLWDSGGNVLGTDTVAVTLRPKASGKVRFTVSPTPTPHHATALLTSSGLASVSATANL